MAFQKGTSKRYYIRWAVLVSFLLHGLLLSVLFYNHSEADLRAAGSKGNVTWIDVSLLTFPHHPKTPREGGSAFDSKRRPSVWGASSDATPNGVAHQRRRRPQTGDSPLGAAKDQNPQSVGSTSERLFSSNKEGATGDRSGTGGEEGASETLRKIRIKIERAKYYPLLAKRSKMEGSPLVEFKIKNDGSVEYVNLKKSSGSQILDDAATATVQKAAPFPFYPDPIALNISYNLGLH